MEIALIAAGAMLLQDVFGTVMMQYEANSLTLPERKHWYDYFLGGWKSWASSVLDQLQWMVAITTTTVAVTAFSGHDLHQKILVFVLVSLANLIGSRAGQESGIYLLRKRGKKNLTDKDRINAIEAWAIGQGYKR